MRDIKIIAYEKYQWHWLMTNNYSISDICIIANDWFNERLADGDNDSSLIDYIFENGINGALWVCFDEFLDCEYRDSEYMRGILTESEYILYCEDIGISWEPETVYVVLAENSYDNVRDYTVHGICRNKAKAKEILGLAVENSGYFDEAKNPDIEDDYASTNNQDVAGADWEEIRIEEMYLL